MAAKRAKVPASVLERAKALATATAPSERSRRAPAAGPASAPAKASPREKVIAALKKLHPMD